MARTATAPPRPTTRPAVTSCSSSVGVPPRPTRTSRAPWVNSSRPRPMPQDVAAGDERRDRQDRRARTRPPGRAPARGPAPRGRGSRSRDRRRGRDRAPRRPSRGGTRPSAHSPSRTAIQSRYTGEDRRDDASCQCRRVGQRVGEDGRPEEGDGKPSRAARASRADTATTAPIVMASATPARAGFTGRPVPAPGGRCREDPERVDRPVAEPRPPDDVVDRHGAELARVGRVRAMVAHQEQLALGDDPAAPGRGSLRRFRRRRHPRTRTAR